MPDPVSASAAKPAKAKVAILLIVASAAGCAVSATMRCSLEGVDALRMN